MRRHKNWLKWSLALVVLTFIVFYIPDFLNVTGAGGVGGEVVAEVDGEPITSAEFIRVYNTQLQAYRSSYGGAMNESLLKQLGIDRQILQQLIDERAALAEAERLGIRASDAEVRERIVRLPGLQENGAFIGEQRYVQLLRMQRPPISPADFEKGIRQSLMLDKLRTAVTGWMTVNDAEIADEYRRRNEKVKLEIVAFTPETFREGLQATDPELATYYEGHKEEYRTGEQRKIRFLLVDTQKVRDQVNVSPQDVEQYYNANLDQFSTPEQVRASHILLKTEGKNEETVRKEAEAVLAKVRAGEDFAELAMKYSEDEGTIVKGGDLDFFPRGRMVSEFDQVAFSMQPGIVSDLVRTQFGFHIIKVTDRRAPAQQTLDQVRSQITEQLKWDRAQTQVLQIASRLAAEIEQPSDLDRVAKANGLTVQETDFVGRGTPIAGLGSAPELIEQVLRLKEGQVSAPVRVPQGQAIAAVVGTREPRVPPLDEVKERVREAVIRQKAVEAARAKARDVVASLKGAADFEAAAKAVGLEVQRTPDFVTRGAALPGVGVSPQVEAAAFAMKPGEVTDPIATDTAVVVAKVTERQEPNPADLESSRATLREELLNEQRTRFFTSYMNKVKERMNITINPDVLQRVVA
jgi:peptidyl-prolyl cis-trans isomerase D